MKTESEKKLESLFTDMMENTNYMEDWGFSPTEKPEFKFLEERKTVPLKAFSPRNSRRLKIAGFVLAVFIVSSVMTIAVNSEFVSASIFKLNNFVFNVKAGFISTDIRLESSSFNAELLIENEEQIPVGKNYLKVLKTPEYIPDGYEFVSLKIVNTPKNEYLVNYVYINDKNEAILITQMKLSGNFDASILGIEADFYIDEAQIFHIPDIASLYNTIHAFTENESISICGMLWQEELIDIFKGFI